MSKIKLPTEPDELYEYLIELGENLVFENSQKIDIYRVWGCQSKTWFVVNVVNDKLVCGGYSESRLVKGLIRLVQLYFDQVSTDEINNSLNDWKIESVNLNNLSGVRQSGLSLILDRIETVESVKN
jgi:sulfur transfer protein SufE